MAASPTAHMTFLKKLLSSELRSKDISGALGSQLAAPNYHTRLSSIPIPTSEFMFPSVSHLPLAYGAALFFSFTPSSTIRPRLNFGALSSSPSAENTSTVSAFVSNGFPCSLTCTHLISCARPSFSVMIFAAVANALIPLTPVRPLVTKSLR